MLEKVLKIYGSKKELADKMGVSQSAVSHWFNDNVVPAKKALLIEEQTKGKIKAKDLI